MLLDKLYHQAKYKPDSPGLRERLQKHIDNNIKTWTPEVKIRCLLYDAVSYKCHTDPDVYTYEQLETVLKTMPSYYTYAYTDVIEYVLQSQIDRMTQAELKAYLSTKPKLPRKLQIDACYLTHMKPDLYIMPNLYELNKIVPELTYIPDWIRTQNLTDDELKTCLDDVELREAIDFNALPRRQQILCVVMSYNRVTIGIGKLNYTAKELSEFCDDDDIIKSLLNDQFFNMSLEELKQAALQPMPRECIIYIILELMCNGTEEDYQTILYKLDPLPTIEELWRIADSHGYDYDYHETLETVADKCALIQYVRDDKGTSIAHRSNFLKCYIDNLQEYSEPQPETIDDAKVYKYTKDYCVIRYPTFITYRRYMGGEALRVDPSGFFGWGYRVDGHINLEQSNIMVLKQCLNLLL